MIAPTDCTLIMPEVGFFILVTWPLIVASIAVEYSKARSQSLSKLQLTQVKFSA